MVLRLIKKLFHGRQPPYTHKYKLSRNEGTLYKLGVQQGYILHGFLIKRCNSGLIQTTYKKTIYKKLIISIRNNLGKVLPHPHSMLVKANFSDGFVYIQREPFSDVAKFSDSVYTYGHKPTELARYLNPPRFLTNEDTVEFNRTLPSTLDALTSIGTPGTIQACCSMSLSSNTGTQGSGIDVGIATGEEEQTFSVSQMLARCITNKALGAPPRSKTALSTLPRCQRQPGSVGVQLSTRPYSMSARSLNAAGYRTKGSGHTGSLVDPCVSLGTAPRSKTPPELSESYEEVSLLMKEPAKDDSQSSDCSQSNAALNMESNNSAWRAHERGTIQETQLMIHLPPLYLCSVRDFGLREYFRRRACRAIPDKARIRSSGTGSLRQSMQQNTYYAPHNEGVVPWVSPETSRSIRSPVVPGIQYKNALNINKTSHSASPWTSMSPGSPQPQEYYQDVTHPSESRSYSNLAALKARDTEVFISPRTPSQSQSSRTAKSIPTNPAKRSVLTDISLHSVNVVTPTTDPQYSLSNISQYDRIQRIFGQRVINSGRKRAIETIMGSVDGSIPQILSQMDDNTTFDTQQNCDMEDAPLPPTDPVPQSASRHKRLIYALSDTAKQRSQGAKYMISNNTHPTPTSELQPPSLITGSMYSTMFHVASQSRNRGLDIVSPFYSPIRSRQSPTRTPSLFRSHPSERKDYSYPGLIPTSQYLAAMQPPSPVKDLPLVAAFPVSENNINTLLYDPKVANITLDDTSVMDTIEAVEEVGELLDMGYQESADRAEPVAEAHASSKQSSPWIIPAYVPFSPLSPLKPVITPNVRGHTPAKAPIVRPSSTAAIVATPAANTAGTRSAGSSPARRPYSTAAIASSSPTRTRYIPRRPLHPKPRRPSPPAPSADHSEERTFDNTVLNNALITDTSETGPCSVPISDDLFEAHLAQGVPAEFYTPANKKTSRPATPGIDTVRLTAPATREDSKDSEAVAAVSTPNTGVRRPRHSTISVTGSPIHVTRRSNASILLPMAALESIRNPRPSTRESLNNDLLRRGTTGNIYFCGAASSSHEKTSISRYIMHPERHRKRSTLRPSKKMSEDDRTSVWSSKTSDMSISCVEYHAAIRANVTIPHLPRYLRYNEFYLERMAEYGRAIPDLSDPCQASLSRSGVESDDEEYSSLSNISWNTQYYIMRPRAQKMAAAEEAYHLAAKRPNNMLKRFLEEKRAVARRRARFHFGVICIAAKVQARTSADGTVVQRIIFDVC